MCVISGAPQNYGTGIIMIFAVHTKKLMHSKERYLPKTHSHWRENSNSPMSNSRAHIMLSPFCSPNLYESFCVPLTRLADKQPQSGSGPGSWVRGQVLVWVAAILAIAPSLHSGGWSPSQKLWQELVLYRTPCAMSCRAVERFGGAILWPVENEELRGKRIIGSQGSFPEASGKSFMWLVGNLGHTWCSKAMPEPPLLLKITTARQSRVWP